MAREAQRSAHVPALDGLRGVAILTVVALHFSLLTPRTDLEWAFARLMGAGWAGVDLFLALSGFLITGILLDGKRNGQSLGPYLRVFLTRRTLRIFPLYYAYLALLFLALPLVRPGLPEENRIWVWMYLSNLLMAIEGWEGMPSHTTHLWSLALEEQFYLLWPLVVYWANDRRLLKICVGGFLFAIATRLGLQLLSADAIAAYTLLPARLDPLTAGAFVAVLLRNVRGADLALRAAPAMAGGSLAALGALGLWHGWFHSEGSFLPPLSLEVQLVGYPAVAVLSTSIIVLALAAPEGSPLHRLLTSRVLLILGKYSYAIYLLHVPLRNATQSALARTGGLPLVFGSQLPAQLLLIPVALLVACLLAILTWHGFEKHFLALKERLAPKPEGSAIVGSFRAAPQAVPHQAWPLGAGERSG
jgi:peptidoglycan/LPS O-acetylase OafA/YrhL